MADQTDPEFFAHVGHVLIGDETTPSEPERAIEMLRAAMEHGSGPAALRAAVFAATGIVKPPDWDEALDFLLRAASLNAVGARAQLALLASLDEGALAGVAEGNLSAVRASIDNAALLTPPNVQTLISAPFIGVMEQFVSPAMARWVMRAGEPHLQRSRVYDPVTGNPAEDDVRTGMTAVMGLMERDLIISVLQARAARATGLPVAQHEPPSVLSYEPGQKFETHVDYLDPAEPQLREELDAIGQRVVTCLTYLNDDYEGGETRFVDIDFSFRGRPGDCLVFRNVRPDRQPDRMTRHAGLPPTRGRKWLLSQWLRDRAQYLM